MRRDAHGRTEDLNLDRALAPVQTSGPPGSNCSPAHLMAELQKLARRYQRALDGLSDSTRDAASGAGQALMRAVSEAKTEGSDGVPAVETLILRTTLATSIVTHLERIPWAAVTLPMLSHLQGSVLSEVAVCTAVLRALLRSALASASTKAAALLLRQVWGPAASSKTTLWSIN